MKFRVDVCLQLWILTYTYFNMVEAAPTSNSEYVTNIQKLMFVKQRICGKELSDLMSSVCQVHNDLRVRRRPAEQLHRVKRQLSNDCCKSSCSYYFIIKYYCQESRIPIDDIVTSSVTPSTYKSSEWAKANVIPVDRSISSSEVKSSMERINRNTGINYSRQVSKQHHHEGQRNRQIIAKKHRWGGKRKKCGCRVKGARKRHHHRGKDKFSTSQHRLSQLIINDVISNDEPADRPPARLGVISRTPPPLIYSNQKLTPRISNTINRHK